MTLGRTAVDICHLTPDNRSAHTPFGKQRACSQHVRVQCEPLRGAAKDRDAVCEICKQDFVLMQNVDVNKIQGCYGGVWLIAGRGGNDRRQACNVGPKPRPKPDGSQHNDIIAQSINAYD